MHEQVTAVLWHASYVAGRNPVYLCQEFRSVSKILGHLSDLWVHTAQ